MNPTGYATGAPIDYAAAADASYGGEIDNQENLQDAFKHLFKPGADVEFFTPPYDQRENKVSVIRPYPCPAGAVPMFRGKVPDTEFVPYRINSRHKIYGYWLKTVKVAWRFGSPAATFIAHVSNNATRYDENVNPAGMIQRAAYSAVQRAKGKWQNSPGERPLPSQDKILAWAGLIEGSPGRAAALTRPKDMVLMQGVVLLNGGELTNQGGKPPRGWMGTKPQVIGLSGGAAEKLHELLRLEQEGFRGSPDDFENCYVHGDPVSLSGGRYITVFRKGFSPDAAINAMPEAPKTPTAYDPYATAAASSFGAPGAGNRDSQAIGWDVSIVKQFRGKEARLDYKPEFVDFVRKQFRWWDDILHYPSEEEQVAIIMQRVPSDLIIYALQGRRDDLITAELRARAAHAAQMVVPGMPAGYQQPVSPVQPAQPPVYTPPYQPYQLGGTYTSPTAGTAPTANPAPMNPWPVLAGTTAPSVQPPNKWGASLPLPADPSVPAPVATPIPAQAPAATETEAADTTEEELRKMQEQAGAIFGF